MKNKLPGDSGLPPGVTNKSIDRRGRELMNMHQCEMCEQLIRSGRTLCNRCERDEDDRATGYVDPENFDKEGLY